MNVLYLIIALCYLAIRPNERYDLVGPCAIDGFLSKIVIIELYRVLLRSMGSTHFWPNTVHLQSVVFKWTQWNISQATTILPAFSLKSIDRVFSFQNILQNILVFSMIILGWMYVEIKLFKSGEQIHFCLPLMSDHHK